MKTLCVLSDTHGYLDAIHRISNVIFESDYVLHLGDGVGDMRSFTEMLGDKFYAVKGNCDCLPYRKEELLEIEGHRILMTHGDLYGVKYSMTALSLRAKELNADVVLFGHTHTAEIFEEGGITFINPGSLSGTMKESFAYVVITKEKVVATINDRI